MFEFILRSLTVSDFEVLGHSEHSLRHFEISSETIDDVHMGFLCLILRRINLRSRMLLAKVTNCSSLILLRRNNLDYKENNFVFSRELMSPREKMSTQKFLFCCSGDIYRCYHFCNRCFSFLTLSKNIES